MTENTTKIKVRRSKDRGHASFGWLKTYHSFSFGDYHDPEHMGFRSLRVINEDVIEPAQGFGTHPHRDMEILTFIFSGALEHKDSMGNGSVIEAGDFQRMTAGTGVRHSEFNPSTENQTKLLQIWILPETKGLEPSYEQIPLKKLQESQPGLRLAADAKGLNALKIHQDVKIFHGSLEPGQEISYVLSPERGLWLQLTKGALKTANETLQAGDGLAVEGVAALTIKGLEAAEFLLFDLK